MSVINSKNLQLKLTIMKLFEHIDRLIIDEKKDRVFLFSHKNLREVIFNDGFSPYVFIYEDGYIKSAEVILRKSDFENAYNKAGETDEEDHIVYLMTLDNDDPQPFVKAEWSKYDPYLQLDLDPDTHAYFDSSTEVVEGVCYLADSCVCPETSFQNFYKFVANDGREFYITEIHLIDNDNFDSRFKFITKEEFEVCDSKTAYNEMISEMNGKGFEMKQSNGGYFCCIHKDKDGVERPVWANTTLEYAYNLEMATAIAYGKCKVWEAEHPFLFIDCPAEDEYLLRNPEHFEERGC